MSAGPLPGLPHTCLQLPPVTTYPLVTARNEDHYELRRVCAYVRR